MWNNNLWLRNHGCWRMLSPMITVHLLLMILAVICLFLAAVRVTSPRGDLLAGGLFLWALASIVSV